MNSYGWTLMSDKQKRLIDAVSALFPNASHKFCVRHLYNNFKGEFKGLILKEIIWKAARATIVPAFKNALEKMNKTDPKAYKCLSERPPINWSRSNFSTFPKCDILLNNLCERFNSATLMARDQSIISMLEIIRHIIMKMVVKRKDAMEKCKGDICPKIFKIVEKLKSHLELWTTNITQELLQPDVCKRASRPKKARRREPEKQATENPDPTRLGRKGTKMTCSICGVQGHNKRSYKKAPVVDTNANGITLEQGPVEGSNGPAWRVGGGRKRGPARRVVDTNSVGTTPVQGSLGTTNRLQTSTVVGNNYGGSSGMTVDGGQPHC
ncbi:hypothetical protein RHSIM_Rhsim01G0148800 [Rhododendron simsii]|uniref:Transposase n=1 Tax=Rhododendron simsii TaxID=118357 RepID=A0A834HJH7_RHOSS|nr:hypothetical protein RHSIM_Rhsim01G0148800 [Rhododendron simsii]